MRQEIARVKLTPGSGGYFDPITRIHLTHGSPEKPVYSGMNVAGLQAAVRNRRISVISGSLGDFVPPFKLVKNNDGRVVLVPNRTAQEQKTKKKVAKKVAEPTVKTTEDTVKEVSAMKPQEIVAEPVIKTTEPISEPEVEAIYEENITEETTERVEITEEVSAEKETEEEDDNAVTDTQETIQNNNNNKKNKKKKK